MAGFLDALLGRSRAKQPDLDALFALPTGAVTLEAATGLRATGVGSVCVKPAEGAAFAQAQAEVEALLRLDSSAAVTASRDAFGYLWTSSSADPDDLPALVTGLHAANATYRDAGFGPALLCSLVGFAGPVDGGSPRAVALVYLYKRGTFYPFAPSGPERRDTALELRVRAAVAGDLPVEPELERWFPVWGAPGL